jgi:uncharacterized delta-60 repeat protein
VSFTGGNRLIALAATLAVIVVFPLLALATPGALDQKFGKKGVATAQVGLDGSGANLVAVADDGGIIAAGMGVLASGEDSEGHFVVAKFTSKGKLDSSFGSKGSTTVDFGGGPLAFDVTEDLALTEDNKILVAGNAVTEDFDYAAGVIRLNANGELDAGFADGGQLISADGGVEDSTAILPLPGGAFYLIGPSKKALEIARFNADGSLDTTFGTGGFTLTDTGGRDIGHAVLTADGKIVVAVGQLGLARFNADGSVDTTFGDQGYAGVPGVSVTNVAQDSKGRLVAALGRTVARFTAGGTPDESFAKDGVFEFSSASGFAGAGLAIGAKDSVVVSGTSKPTKSKATADHRFAVAVLKGNGTLNRKFGNRGFTADKHGDIAKAVTTQDDGKIVAAGRTFGRSIFIGSIAGRDTAMMLARYLKP